MRRQTMRPDVPEGTSTQTLKRTNRRSSNLRPTIFTRKRRTAQNRKQPLSVQVILTATDTCYYSVGKGRTRTWNSAIYNLRNSPNTVLVI